MGDEGTERDEGGPVFSKGRDLGATRAALERWIATKVPGADAVRVSNLEYPVGAGVSNETILFDADWDESGSPRHAEWVLRVHPHGFQLFLDPGFRKQYDLLRVLSERKLVKVPAVQWYEEDASVVGQPFFLMNRMHGRVPVSMPVYNATGWLTEATPEQRRTLWLSAMREFTAIHRVDPQLVPFLDMPEYGTDGLRQEVEYWARLADWGMAGEVPDVMLAILDWLRANVPADHVDGVSWGDARIGNMMFGDDFEVVGVMDWEQATLSGGLRDLGWWLFFDDYHSAGHGIPRLDGLGSRPETIELWEELVGRRATNLRWYETLAGFETAVLAFRSRFLHTGDCGPAADNSFVGRLHLLLDGEIGAPVWAGAGVA